MKVFYNENYAAPLVEFDTTRKASAVAQSLMIDKIKNVELVSPDDATFEDLCLVHDPFYVSAVMTGQNEIASSSGLKWDEGIWDMAAASVGGIISAAKEAMETKTISGSLSSGLHHARYEKGKGFCTFNGLALVATKYAMEEAKILIVDLDAHCGGGTFSIVKDNKNIWQVDISTSNFDDYFPTKRHSLDLIYNHGDYISSVEKRLSELLSTEKFDLILYNAGMDPHQGCSTGGMRGITKSILKQREKMIFDWCRNNTTPSVFVLAGGYAGEHLDKDELVELHRFTVESACRS